MKKRERKLTVYEISGRVAVGLFIGGFVLPSVAFLAWFFTPIALFIWLWGECAK